MPAPHAAPECYTAEEKGLWMASESETGMMYRIDSVCDGQVNIQRSNGVGPMWADNGLWRNDLTFVLTALKQLGQGRLSQLVCQLQEELAEQDALQPNSLRARLRLVAEDAAVQALPDRLVAGEDVFTMASLSEHLDSEADPAGQASARVGPWVFDEFRGKTGCRMYSVSNCHTGAESRDFPALLAAYQQALNADGVDPSVSEHEEYDSGDEDAAARAA